MVSLIEVFVEFERTKLIHYYFSDIIDKNSERWLIEFNNSTFNDYAMNKTSFDRVIFWARHYLFPIFMVTTDTNPKYPYKYNLTIQQPSTFFSKFYYDDPVFVSGYKSYLLKLISFMLEASNTTNPEMPAWIDSSVNLEVQFAQVNPFDFFIRNFDLN